MREYLLRASSWRSTPASRSLHKASGSTRLPACSGEPHDAKDDSTPASRSLHKASGSTRLSAWQWGGHSETLCDDAKDDGHPQQVLNTEAHFGSPSQPFFCCTPPLPDFRLQNCTRRPLVNTCSKPLRARSSQRNQRFMMWLVHNGLGVYLDFSGVLN